MSNIIYQSDYISSAELFMYDPIRYNYMGMECI